jgi:mannose-1-phosphate guanylyltransferase
MNVVFLSGGSGKRLWPLSNDTLSKQFLKLLKNQRNEYESMVQRVVRQLRTAHTDASVFVSCNIAQEDIVKKQLTSVETICEPGRRDTFPAIVLAAAYLRYIKQMGEDEAFIVCPIDPYAESAYFELLGNVNYLVSSGDYKIGLLGAKPTYPAEKYGYIMQENGNVTGFVEKPELTRAEKLVQQGALWNCGVFALKIGYVLNHAKKYIDFNDYETLRGQYDKLPRISFDYEVVEKEPGIGAIVYDGKWKDLGTWNTLTEELGSDTIGQNILVSDESNNTHVLNMLNIPIIIQDINDAVVVASYDGILVSSKQGSSYLKPLAEQIIMRPMYEQRGWGNYRILEYKQNDEKETLVKRIKIDAGKEYFVDDNRYACISYTVLSGKGILKMNGEELIIKKGNVLSIDGRNPYTIFSSFDLELIEVLC